MQKINTSQDHAFFMKRCLELALNGLSFVAPNPMVGAVVVYKGKIIGEGYHRKFGEAHAEVNAINSVKNQELLPDSTLYVNLEPCAHAGKTPPCTDLILGKKIPRVVVGTSDPNSLVAGKGIQKLKNYGVEVHTDILPRECFELNRRFFTFHEKKRPFIILKWAQTRDGFIDIKRKLGTPIGVNWISTPLSRTLVHRWRSEEQGILIGTNTAILDNPNLTLRHWKGKNPIRIILDRQLRIPENSNVWNDETETLIYNSLKKECKGMTELVNIDFSRNNLMPILTDLYQREISSIIVEGGKSVLEYFIQNELWDEVRIFIGNKNFIDGVEAPEFKEVPVSSQIISDDKLLIFRRL